MPFFVKALIGLAIIGVAVAFVGICASLRRVTRHYAVMTDKLNGPLRMALLSDLHAARYGKKQEELVGRIAALKPDILLFAGDVVAEDKDRMPAHELLSALGKAYPCYYVTGNHEYRLGKPQEVREFVRSLGVTVLQGTAAVVDTPAGRICVAGTDDPLEGEEIFLSQAEKSLAAASETGAWTVFLCHHPERVVALAKENGLPFDLALSGHAHGGQWRLPGLINGVFAPHQGIFPKYAGGRYDLGGGRTLIVGRGLSKDLPKGLPIPRIFNPPELVVIDVNSRS